MKQTALLLALLLLAPVAMAGSESDPEINDDSGDDVSSIPGLGAAANDITKVWVGEETPEDFTFYMKVDATPNPDPSEYIDYELSIAGIDFGGQVFSNGVENSYTTLGASTAFDGTTSTLSFTVPRSAFGELIPGQELTGFTAFAEAYIIADGSQVVWNEQDTAPDSGSGKAYIVGSNAAPGMDFDADGLDDADEIRLGSDPTVVDTDGDGLTDGDEVHLHNTSAVLADTDQDNLNDGDEIAIGSDPNNPDTDGDGLGDGNETGSPLLRDTDADGVNDFDEFNASSDPNLPDSDNDGVGDKFEIDNGMNPNDPSDGAADPDGDGVSTADELLIGGNPFVADQEEPDDVLIGQEVPFELPGDFEDWFWLTIIALILLLFIALIVWLIILLARRKKDDEPEEEPVEGEEDVLSLDTEESDDELSDEQIARARRLFEERERRYLDYVAPERNRAYDDPITPLEPADLAPETELSPKEEKALAKAEAKAAKQAAKEEKKREKALAKLAKKEAKATE